jgi:hypothetical protein
LRRQPETVIDIIQNRSVVLGFCLCLYKDTQRQSLVNKYYALAKIDTTVCIFPPHFSA